MSDEPKVTSENCLTCGACCTAPLYQDAFCNVTKGDAARLGKRFVRLHVWQPSTFDQLAHAIDGTEIPWGAIKTKTRVQKAGPLKGKVATVCRMLDGDVGHRVSCRVYEERPDVCHTAVVPGDKACLSLRKQLREAKETCGYAHG